MKRFAILTKVTEDKDVSGSDAVFSVRNLLKFRRSLFYPKDTVLWLFDLYFGCSNLYCDCLTCTLVVLTCTVVV